MNENQITLRRADMFDPAYDPAGVIAEADGLLSGFVAALRRGVQQAVAWWLAELKFRQQLAELSSFDDRMLADMGFTRDDLSETRKARRWIRSRDLK
jgi:uncharacterized protein YjiS (DUF1127 family)